MLRCMLRLFVARTVPRLHAQKIFMLQKGEASLQRESLLHDAVVKLNEQQKISTYNVVVPQQVGRKRCTYYST